MADTFICGQCSQSYHDISVFLQHKNECGAVVSETAVSNATDAPQDGPPITALLVDSSHLQVDGQLAEEFLSGQQFVMQTDGMMGELAIIKGELNASDTAVTLVPVTSVSESGATSLAESAKPDVTWPSHHIQVLVSDSSQAPAQSAPVVQAAPKTGRKRGRPRKGEGKPAAEPVQKPEEVQRPTTAERRPDGLFHCSSCKKTFRKERHFTTHKCLACSDYVDITRKEVVDGDESDDEQDTDSTADFNAYNSGTSTGRCVRRRLAHVAPEGVTEVGIESDTKTVDASSTVMSVTENSVDMAEIAPLPVFTEEEDKVLFEQNMNVDLSQVDDMFRTLLIDQDVNEAGQASSGGRTQDQLTIFSCNVCSKVFMSLSHMRQHCLIHTDLKPFKCAKCDYSTNTKGNLYTHMRKHTGQMYRCEKCAFTTTNKGHLLEHSATHSGIRHACELCNNDYNTPKSLQNHIRKYHAQTKAGREYLARFLLNSGKRGTGGGATSTHVGAAILHQCHVCNRKFKKKIDCDRHLFVHNIKDNPNVFACGLCDYAASRRPYLEQHYRRHRIIYTCIRCPSELFPSSIRLRTHLLEHLAYDITGQQYADAKSQGAVLSAEQFATVPQISADSADVGAEPDTAEAGAEALEAGPGTVEAGQVTVGEGSVSTDARPHSGAVTPTVTDAVDGTSLVIATAGTDEPTTSASGTFIDAYETYIAVGDGGSHAVGSGVEGADGAAGVCEVLASSTGLQQQEEEEFVGTVVNAEDLEELFRACIDASFYLAGSSDELLPTEEVEGNENEIDTVEGFVEFFNSAVLKGTVEGDVAIDQRVGELESATGIVESSGDVSQEVSNLESVEKSVNTSETAEEVSSKMGERIDLAADALEQDVNNRQEAMDASGTLDVGVNGTEEGDTSEAMQKDVDSLQTAERDRAVNNSEEGKLNEAAAQQECTTEVSEDQQQGAAENTEDGQQTGDGERQIESGDWSWQTPLVVGEVKHDEVTTRATRLREMWQRLGYRPLNVALLEQLRSVFGRDECEYCGRLFSSLADYNSHLRTHTGDKRYVCNQCDYRSNTKGNLKRHIERAHDMLQLPCTQCAFVARSRTQLWMHTQRHRQPTITQCEKCNITFDSTKRLKIHLQMKHTELKAADIKLLTSASQKTETKLGRVNHKCPYCEKTFVRVNSDLRKHIWMHEGVRPFRCPHCPHACRSKNNLQAHLLRHSAHKPFLCNECGKAYKSKTALRWHVRSHTMGKMFKCDRCPYEAVQKSHLKRHSETHDIIKRFACEHCDYSANTLGYLKIHYTRQHRGREYTPQPAGQSAGPTTGQAESDGRDGKTNIFRCLSCDYLFGNLSDLKRHLRVKHHIEASDMEALSKLSVSQLGVAHMVADDEDKGEQGPEDVLPITEDFQIIKLKESSTNEETALQALHYTVDSEADVTDQRVPAMNLLQQIIDMSQEGSVKHDQQIMVQSADGENVITVSPNTIIVQQDDLQQMMLAGGGSANHQYIIEYVSEQPEDSQSQQATHLVEMAEETVASGTEVVLDTLDCSGATWQVVQQVNASDS